jgi:hypothetical protein
MLLVRPVILVVKSVIYFLLFLCAIWKFHQNLIKLRFISAVSSTSLSLMFLSCSVLSTKLYYLWAINFWCETSQRVMFHVGSNWILHDSVRAVDMFKLLNFLYLLVRVSDGQSVPFSWSCA